jgi:hypothetical protein
MREPAQLLLPKYLLKSQTRSCHTEASMPNRPSTGCSLSSTASVNPLTRCLAFQLNSSRSSRQRIFKNPLSLARRPVVLGCASLANTASSIVSGANQLSRSTPPLLLPSPRSDDTAPPLFLPSPLRNEGESDGLRFKQVGRSRILNFRFYFVRKSTE